MTVSPTLGAVSDAGAAAEHDSCAIFLMTPERRKVLMPKEVAVTVWFYPSGKIDHAGARQDFSGVIF